MQPLLEAWRKYLKESAGGTIIAIFGPSGCGKSWHKNTLKKMGWKEIVSTSTRQPRGKEDIEYSFLQKGEWQKMKEDGLLINTNYYEENYYGTRFKDFKNAKKSVMLTDFTNVNGSRGYDDLKKIAEHNGKNLILVYCVPPSSQELITRHQERGTPERIERAAKEMGEMNYEVKTNIPEAIWVDSDEDIIELANSLEGSS